MVDRKLYCKNGLTYMLKGRQHDIQLPEHLVGRVEEIQFLMG